VTGEPAPCTAFSVRDCRRAEQVGTVEVAGGKEVV